MQSMHFLSKAVYEHLLEHVGSWKLNLVEDDCGNYAIFFQEYIYESWLYRYCPNRYPRSLKRWARKYYIKPDYTIDDVKVLKQLQAEFHIFD